MLSLPVAARSIQCPGAAGRRLRESIASAFVGKHPCIAPLQDNNVVVKTWGTPREEPELLNHVDLVAKLGIADLEKGTAVAGWRPQLLYTCARCRPTWYTCTRLQGQAMLAKDIDVTNACSAGF